MRTPTTDPPADPARRYWLTDGKVFLVFDCETIGIHGEAYAVGYTLIDRHGKLVEVEGVRSEDWWSCPPEVAMGASYAPSTEGGKRQEAEDRQWGADNVPAEVRTQITCNYPTDVRERFWKVWIALKQHFGDRLIMAAECTWPVEAAFLSNTIADDPDCARHWEGPHPVLDISGVCLAAGMDPCGWYERSADEPAHHPLGDSRQSARLLLEALDRCEKGWRNRKRLECFDCYCAGAIMLAVAAHPLEVGAGICQDHLDQYRQAEHVLAGSDLTAGGEVRVAPPRWEGYPACPACGKAAGWGGGTDDKPQPWCNHCNAGQPGWADIGGGE